MKFALAALALLPASALGMFLLGAEPRLGVLNALFRSYHRHQWPFCHFLLVGRCGQTAAVHNVLTRHCPQGSKHEQCHYLDLRGG